LLVKEYRFELSPQLDDQRLLHIQNKLEELNNELLLLANSHPQYPILWFVRGELNLLRHHNQTAITDFTNALTDFDQLNLSGVDNAALRKLTKDKPYFYLAALGRAKARLREYCMSYLGSEMLTGISAHDYRLRADKMRKLIKRDFELAARGEIPFHAQKNAEMFMVYSSATMKNFLHADELADKIIDRGGYIEDAWFMKAVLHSYKTKEAFEFYQKSLTLCYNQPHAWLYLGLVYLLNENDIARADEAVAHALRLKPGFFAAEILRAMFYCKEKKFREAMAVMQNIPANKQNNPVFYHWRGVANAGLGNNTRGLADFATALRIQPSYSLVRKDYGQLLCQLGKNQAAEQQWRQYLANPIYSRYDWMAVVNSIVRLQLDTGRAADALSFINKQLKTSPKQPSLLIFRAEIHEYLGQMKLAMNDLEYAVKRAKDSSHPQIKSAKRRLAELKRAHP